MKANVSGWFKQSLRHSNARRFGRAGGKYATPIYMSWIDKNQKHREAYPDPQHYVHVTNYNHAKQEAGIPYNLFHIDILPDKKGDLIYYKNDEAKERKFGKLKNWKYEYETLTGWRQWVNEQSEQIISPPFNKKTLLNYYDEKVVNKMMGKNKWAVEYGFTGGRFAAVPNYKYFKTIKEAKKFVNQYKKQHD